MSVSSRTRRIVATVLIVLGAVLLVAASVEWWASRTILDGDRFAALGNDIIESPNVQTALSDKVVEVAGGQERFGIATPLVKSIVDGVVGSNAFATVFDRALRRVHTLVTDSNARDILLDLGDTYTNVRQTIVGFAPALAQRLPETSDLQIRLSERSTLVKIWNALDRIKTVMVVVAILGVVLAVAGLGLAVNRWRALALLSWVWAGVAALILLVVAIGRRIFLNQVKVNVNHDAAIDVFRIVSRGLVVQMVVLTLLAIVVALIASWTDRAGGLRSAWSGLGAPDRNPIDRVRAIAFERSSLWVVLTLVGLALFALFWPAALGPLLVVVLVFIGITVAVVELLAWIARHTRPAAPAASP